VEGHAVAARAAPELAAEPGILIVGVDQEVIDPREVGGEAADEVLVAIMHAGIEEAVRRRIAVVGVAVVGRAEVEEGLQARGPRHVETGRDEVPTDRPRLVTRPAVQIHDLRTAGRHLGRRLDDVLQVQRLVVGPGAPREVELHLGEPPLA